MDAWVRCVFQFLLPWSMEMLGRYNNQPLNYVMSLENGFFVICGTMESVPCVYELNLKAYYKAKNGPINLLIIICTCYLDWMTLKEACVFYSIHSTVWVLSVTWVAKVIGNDTSSKYMSWFKSNMLNKLYILIFLWKPS